VAEVISGWTGIPLGRMVADEIGTIRNLKNLLEARVIGQTYALELIARHIQIARANLEDPGKPKGVFLLVGPSGVGKTETALALVDVLYGGERNLISINMSEYQEAHTVSGLKGSPPGYVGYGEGGVLTEAVRRKPYSVVLLDEVEKAHPDVLELFYQVFDKGQMEDAEGREIDFRNTIIILTSNIGSDLVMRAVEHGVKEGEKTRQPTPQDLVEILRATLQKAFKPAFLGRLSVVPYYPVQDEILKAIIRLKLEKICRRIEANHAAVMTYDEAMIALMAERCTEVESGARNADAIISNLILSELSSKLLERMAEGRKIKTIAVKLKKGKVGFQIT
jgi:type VI secretion system protein VasG